MDRAERRRQERTAAKQQRRNPPPKVVIAGRNMIATELTGHRYEGRPARELPPKQPGEHRWIVIATYVISPEAAEHLGDADTPKFLDHENLFDLSAGCWDCEEVWTAETQRQRCPAPGNPE